MNQLKVVLIFVIIFLLYKLCNKKDVIEGWTNLTGNPGTWSHKGNRNPENGQWRSWYDWFRMQGANRIRRESDKGPKVCMSDTANFQAGWTGMAINAAERVY